MFDRSVFIAPVPSQSSPVEHAEKELIADSTITSVSLAALVAEFAALVPPGASEVGVSDVEGRPTPV